MDDEGHAPVTEETGHVPPAPPDEPEFGDTWVYESIVEAVPGIDVSERAALVLQFAGFEVAALALAAVYDLWAAVPAATAAIAVATAGSLLMQQMAGRIRRAGVPEAYRRAVLGSSIEVVLGLLAFLLLVTYLFVVDARDPSVAGVALRAAEQPLLTAVFGERPPAAAVYLALLVLWDVCYRIGTGWWAAVVAFWRSYRYDFDAATARELRGVDRLNLGFGLVQLVLLPFLWEYTLLLVAVAGHVVAVLVVGGLALALLES